MSRHRPIVALVLGALLTTSCIHGQAYKAHSLMNQHLFREARYEESCLPLSTKPYCSAATQARLNTFRKHLLELSQAITLGGSASLQLALAEKDAAALKDVK